MLIVRKVLCGANGLEEILVCSKIADVSTINLFPVQCPSSESGNFLRACVRYYRPFQVERGNPQLGRQGLSTHPCDHTLMSCLFVPEIDTQPREQLVDRVQFVPQGILAIKNAPSISCSPAWQSAADILKNSGCESFMREYIMLLREVCPAIWASGKLADTVKTGKVTTGCAVRLHHDIQADPTSYIHCHYIRIPSEHEIFAMLQGKTPLSCYLLSIFG